MNQRQGQLGVPQSISMSTDERAAYIAQIDLAIVTAEVLIKAAEIEMNATNDMLAYLKAEEARLVCLAEALVDEMLLLASQITNQKSATVAGRLVAHVCIYAAQICEASHQKASAVVTEQRNVLAKLTNARKQLDSPIALPMFSPR